MNHTRKKFTAQQGHFSRFSSNIGQYVFFNILINLFPSQKYSMHCQLEKSMHPAADVSIVQTSKPLHASGEIEAKFRTTQGFESGALDEVDYQEGPKIPGQKRSCYSPFIPLYPFTETLSILFLHLISYLQGAIP
jgi:hypothetical protein